MSKHAPPLLADCMLGSLAKWLRLMGYDTAFETDAPDHHLARRARAEGRVLLTRDRELAQRRGLDTLLIRSQDLGEQVQQVVEAVGPSVDAALSRCAACNSPLVAVSAHQIADRVPPYVLRTQSEFSRCPGCGRVYWPGSHVDEIQEQIDEWQRHSHDASSE